MRDEQSQLDGRARRAVPLIAAALAVIVVAGFIYLHPQFGTASRAVPVLPAPSPPLLGTAYTAMYDFVTPSVGWVLVIEAGNEIAPYWIFSTTDAAKHWTLQLSSSSNSPYGTQQIVFLDRLHGFFSVGGDAVQRTADGGRHWEPVTLPPYGYSEVTFVDPLHGWYLGYLPPESVRQPAVYRFESTSDGGVTWIERRLPSGASGFFAFRPPAEGWTSGPADVNPVVFSTQDGGLAWRSHEMPASAAVLQGKPFVPQFEIRLLPRSGVMMITGDSAFTSFASGATWHSIAIPPPGNSYDDIAFLDDTHWWTMRKGDLFKSSDGGMSWNHVHLQVDGWDYGVHVIDPVHAWATLDEPYPRTPGLGGGLAFTFDGGFHWTYANVPAPPG